LSWVESLPQSSLQCIYRCLCRQVPKSACKTFPMPLKIVAD
jgi:hypothetical protein